MTVLLICAGVVATVGTVYEVGAIRSHGRLPTVCHAIRHNPPAQVVVRHLCLEHHR